MTTLLLPDVADREALLASVRNLSPFDAPCDGGLAWALAGCPTDDPRSAGYISWIAARLAGPALAAYELVERPALASLQAVCDPALAAYVAVCEPAEAAYHVARANAAIAAALGRLP